MYKEGLRIATAKVFKSGNSQAVRLPKQFRLRSAAVAIYRRASEIILREKPKGLADALRIISELPEDMFDCIHEPRSSAVLEFKRVPDLKIENWTK